jgi:hypothetical protein
VSKYRAIATAPRELDNELRHYAPDHEEQTIGTVGRVQRYFVHDTAAERDAHTAEMRALGFVVVVD